MPYDVLLVAVCAACTFLTRLFPFAVFGTRQRPSQCVRYIGRALPTAVMAILIVYCLRAVPLTFGGVMPQALGIAVTACLHLWKHNSLLSIGGGTLSFMLLSRLVFV